MSTSLYIITYVFTVAVKSYKTTTNFIILIQRSLVLVQRPAVYYHSHLLLHAHCIVHVFQIKPILFKTLFQSQFLFDFDNIFTVTKTD